MSENKLIRIDEGINSCVLLTELDLSINQLANINNNIFSTFVNLTKITLSSNLIEVFPQGLLECSKIEKIDLSYNKLKSVDGNFKYLVSLTSISLDYNELCEFP